MGFSCLWENDLGTWGHERCVRFEFLEECSPMTVALRYREEMKKLRKEKSGFTNFPPTPFSPA